MARQGAMGFLPVFPNTAINLRLLSCESINKRVKVYRTRGATPIRPTSDSSDKIHK